VNPGDSGDADSRPATPTCVSVARVAPPDPTRTETPLGVTRRQRTGASRNARTLLASERPSALPGLRCQIPGGYGHRSGRKPRVPGLRVNLWRTCTSRFCHRVTLTIPPSSALRSTSPRAGVAPHRTARTVTVLREPVDEPIASRVVQTCTVATPREPAGRARPLSNGYSSVPWTLGALAPDRFGRCHETGSRKAVHRDAPGARVAGADRPVAPTNWERTPSRLQAHERSDRSARRATGRKDIDPFSAGVVRQG
jgi:hypothetical protein